MSERRISMRGVFVSVSVVLGAVACGSAAHTSGFDEGLGDSGGGDDGSAIDGNTGPAPNFNGGDGSDDGAVATDSGLNACATDSQQAKLAPLDLMLMQDTSGSMWEYVAATGTTTKWDTIKQALTTFMADPSSTGIGLGIQFFPLFQSAVPNSCAANADCGAAGTPCEQKACSKSEVLCTTAADCAGGGGTCTALQRCHGEQEFYCLSNNDCLLEDAMGNIYDFRPCDQPIVRGTCYNESISCTPADYTTPAAAIAALPGAATGVTAALNAHIPNGQTPTHDALQGAINAAQAYATAHSSDVVAVVLSTDGIPYTNGTCDDAVADIEAIAAAGLAGTPSVKTFVIGTLSPADNTTTATSTLNGIAAAGGTTSATIIGTSATTEADFIAALDKIRGQSLPCQFALPVPEAGTPDYNKVNVVYTASKTSAQTVIGYVEAQGACDPTTGGWYYDVDPSEGGTPTKVILCPATCTEVQADPAGQVNVVQGCATKTVGPPK